MMKFSYVLLILIIPFFFSACSQKELDFEKPEIQVPKVEKTLNQKKGALYSRQGTSLFADKKDLQIGDIIQVVITEALSNDSSSDRELKNSRSASLGGLNVTANTATLGGSHQKKYADRLNNTFGASMTSTGSSNFKGESSSTVSESFQTTVSVIIEETYQNGNYYIKGTKEMLIDEQMQKIIISGVIRPYDITPDNSIESTQVANLKILYKKDGTEKDVLNVPWLFNLLIKFFPL